MQTIGVVSCTKKKQTHPCKAYEMYSASELFSKAYAYAKENYNQVVILSAKYGLLFPEDRIEPYDLTLKSMKAPEVKEWSEMVFKQMQKHLSLKEISIICFHAGSKYRKYLIPQLQALGIECKVPLAKLGIGKQLKWYNTQTRTSTKGETMQKPTFGEVWKRILACEGEEFRTTNNLPFTYSINDHSLRPSRARQNIGKTEFAKAYDLVPINSPGEITNRVRGPSYVWAILHDQRISKDEW